MNDVKLLPPGANEAAETNKIEAELKAKYGEVYRLETDLEDETGNITHVRVYTKRPHRIHLSRFAKEVAKDTFKALNTLIFDTAVWPEKDELTRLFEDRPGLVISLGSELQKLVGVNQDFLCRKL